MTWRANLRTPVVVSIVLMAFVSPSAAKVIYVDANAPGPTHNGSSWTNAYNYLQDALASAVSGDEIWVAEGIYRPDEDAAHPYGTGDRTDTFQLKNGVAVYGGFQGFISTQPPPPPPPPMSLDTLRTTTKDSNQAIQPKIVASTNANLDESDPNARDIELYETILNGDLNGDDTDANSAWDLWGDPARYDNSFHVVTGSGTDETAVLDGFTISAGYADGTGIDNRGGGMFNNNGNPTLANCTFYANCGGGMYCEAGNPELTNCAFKMNITLGIGGGIDISNCNPTLTGCLFIANVSHNGAGMSNHLSNPNLINCTFYANEAGSVGGAMCTDLSSPVMSNCTFRENMSGIIAGGMYFAGGSPILTNCALIKNSALTSGGGVMVNSSTDLTLTNCTFSGNSAMSGSVMDNFHSTITLTNCILGDNLPPQIGDYNSTSVVTYSDIQGGWPGIGNIDADPCFVDANNDDYHLQADSPCINAGDPNFGDGPYKIDLDYKERVLGGRIDMGAYEYQELTILYVDENALGPAHDGSNWPNAYQYLQDALTDANSSTKPLEIWVACGIYKPDQRSANPNGTGDREATFQLINGVSIKGGYAGFSAPNPNARDIGLYETILSGDLAGDDVNVDDPRYLLVYPCRADNSYTVVTGSWTEANAVLDGFTITAGNANEISPFPHTNGGGMYSYVGRATIISCTFSYNSARTRGGGMFNDHYPNACDYCTPKIENCTFIYNFASSGGGIYNWESNPTISNCKFIGNISERGHGGGVRNTYSHPIVTNCLFTRNSAVDISAGGAMSNYKSSPTLTNCTFTGNSAATGGGIDNNSSSPILTNCLFIQNSADIGGGGIDNYSSSGYNGTVTNCILWGNIPEEIRGSANITYSDIKGGWPGLGNIDIDPCFVDANSDDYHLKSQAGRWDANSESWIKYDVTSPCIDAGNPGCPVDDETVPNGNRINMGAYGGTAEASKSPTYWRSLADTTNDWIVDSNDLKVLADYWLQMGECIPGDFDRSQSVDFNDFAILGGLWSQKGPGPGITYDIGGCIPVDFPSSTTEEPNETRFTVTVEGSNIHFEDMITANCCADEIELQMTVEAGLITIYEIEHTSMPPCPCICDYPITAKLGPFEPGTYIFEVYHKSSFIGSTTVTIENDQ